eukprot:scaffold6226_cov118-Cylindrotheca_fusiformis.AAC.9
MRTRQFFFVVLVSSCFKVSSFVLSPKGGAGSYLESIGTRRSRTTAAVLWQSPSDHEKETSKKTKSSVMDIGSFISNLFQKQWNDGKKDEHKNHQEIVKPEIAKNVKAKENSKPPNKRIVMPRKKAKSSYNTTNIAAVAAADTESKEAGAVTGVDFQQRLLRERFNHHESSSLTMRTRSKSAKHIRIIKDVYAEGDEPPRKGNEKRLQPENDKGEPIPPKRNIPSPFPVPFQQRLLHARYQYEANAKKKEQVPKKQNQKHRNSQFQQRPLAAIDQNKPDVAKLPKQSSEESKKRRQQQKQSQFHQLLLQARYQCDVNAKRMEQDVMLQRVQIERKRQQFQLHRRLLEAKYQSDANAKQLEQDRIAHHARQIQLLQAKRRQFQFQRRLLEAKYQSDANAKQMEQDRIAHQARQTQLLQKKRRQYDFQRRLLETRYQCDANAKQLEHERIVDQERQLQLLQKKHRQFQFQQRLLEAKHKCDANAQKVEQDRIYQANQIQLLEKKRRQFQFHRRLLQARNECDAKARDIKMKKRLREIRILEDNRKKQEQKFKKYSFQMQLLAARFFYQERAKQFRIKSLLQQIRKQQEEERKLVKYQFQRRLLATTLEINRKTIERRRQDKLNAILQNRRLISYTTRKISSKAKFRFQRKLLAATLEIQAVERHKKQLLLRQKQQMLLQEQLMQERLLREAKTLAIKRQQQEQSKFQRQLVSFYQSLEQWQQEKNKAAQQRKEVRKQKTAFQEQLLAARIRNDLLRKEQVAKEQMEELQRSLREAQVQSELAAAEAARAEERKRQAQLEMERKKAEREASLREEQRQIDLQRQLEELAVEEKRQLEAERQKAQQQSLLEQQRQEAIQKQLQALAEEEKLQVERERLEQKRQEAIQQQLKELEEEEKRQAERERNEADRLAQLENERKAALQKQIEESESRQEALRRELEEAGRLQNTDASSSGKTIMDEYRDTLERQRKQEIQKKMEDNRRRQEDLQRKMEEAGRIRASEQTMDHYEATLQQQQEANKLRQMEESKQRQETLRQQMENAGRDPPPIESTSANLDQYANWMQQDNKTLLPQNSVALPPPIVSPEDKIDVKSENPTTPQQGTPLTVEQQTAPSSPVQQQAQTQQQLQPQQQHQENVDPLVGQVLLSKFHVTEKLRVGGDRSELYKCFHNLDQAQQYPLVIKLSHNTEQIELEHRIYGDLFGRLAQDRQHLFVRAYDWVGASPQTNGRVGFAMECGIENLRGHVWRHGPYTGAKLRSVMENVIRIVESLHGLGVVWSELKAENFIVFDGDVIKAVDLESVAAHGENLRAYTAETYPPEFPAESLYQCLPKIPVDYSFDVWGLGLTLYEIAVGEPLFTLQRTYDVEYIKERLKNPEGIIAEANKKMWKVESGARNVIRQCLVVDPQKRSTCEQLLQDAYFQRQPSNQPATATRSGAHR